MKKQNFKNLKLNKKPISNLNTENVKGGTGVILNPNDPQTYENLNCLNQSFAGNCPSITFCN